MGANLVTDWRCCWRKVCVRVWGGGGGGTEYGTDCCPHAYVRHAMQPCSSYMHKTLLFKLPTPDKRVAGQGGMGGGGGGGQHTTAETACEWRGWKG